jgi:uroporphyrinogen III methyltransferase / synthase
LSGMVHLVGGGPGDPKLLTRRAHELLLSADLVVIDALISPEIRSLVPSATRIIEAGKRASKHTMPQEAINQLLIDEARAGRSVVRLKGGDPFVFGRGGEEAEDLVAAGIAFEIVPGIPSAIAAPAYAGIPVTHRDHATSVTFVTGHESDGSRGVNWSALAQLDGTVVFLMGLSNLEMICRQMIGAGRPASTPVAVISKGTTPEHRSVTGSLATIGAAVREASLPPPALIVIGSVSQLSTKLRWFESRPMLGRSIVVTRARAQASELVEILRADGARVLEFPTITIEPADHPSLRTAIEALDSYDWIVFTSSNGVQYFFERLLALGRDARALSGKTICAVGGSTADALRERGVRPDIVPEKYQSSALVPLLPPDMRGSKLLLVRAEQGRDDIPEGARARNGSADLAIAYRTLPVGESTAAIASMFEEGSIDAITFTSSSTADNFFDAIDAKTRELARNVTIASIGPSTTESLRRWNVTDVVEAKSADVRSLAEALRHHFSK